MSEGMSKAAKKNAKRKAAKRKDRGPPTEDGKVLTDKDILEKLKDELDISKQRKDHERSGKLRDQIWVLTDLVAGVRTDIPEMEMRQILHSIDFDHSSDRPDAVREPKPASSSSNLTPEEKRIKVLKKKLRDIEKLKELKAKGQKLEVMQVEKIEAEDKIKEELSELKDLIKLAAKLGEDLSDDDS